MKIANVIFEKELVNHTEVDYVNYYKGLQGYDKLDKSLPTLYVGWSFMKACNPNNEIIQHADILKKKIITNELYWECSFEESKSSHVNGVDSFVNLAPQFYFLPKYTYVNLDPIFFQIVDIEGLMDIVPKEIDATYVYRNDMIYVLKGNKIWGINLKLYDYFKFNISNIIDSLQHRSINYYDDPNGKIYMLHYKTFPNFTQLKRYLITILDN